MLYFLKGTRLAHWEMVRADSVWKRSESVGGCPPSPGSTDQTQRNPHRAPQKVLTGRQSRM